jgi:hypothetical protein
VRAVGVGLFLVILGISACVPTVLHWQHPESCIAAGPDEKVRKTSSLLPPGIRCVSVGEQGGQSEWVGTPFPWMAWLGVSFIVSGGIVALGGLVWTIRWLKGPPRGPRPVNGALKETRLKGIVDG